MISDDMIMSMAWEASKRSSCLRTKVVAIAVTEDESLLTGYSGNTLCNIKGCMRPNVLPGQSMENCRGVHAEIKAVLLAGDKQIEKVYVTHSPCTSCARFLAYVGVKEVIFDIVRPDFSMAYDILTEGDVKVRRREYVRFNENAKQS